MKDAFGWISKVKEITIKTALTILAQNLTKLVSELGYIQGILTSPTAPSGSPPNIYNQLIRDRLGVDYPQRYRLVLVGYVLDYLLPAGVEATAFFPYNSQISANGSPTGAPQVSLDFEGETVTLVDAVETTKILISKFARGLRTSTPTELTMGVVADGEFLKRVGATIVGGAAGGGGSHAATHEDGGADEISVADLSGLLADPQTPLAHATSHEFGGSDDIKLDDLAAPDDNTDLNASLTAHGLLRKLPGGTTTFLRADGSFAAPGGGGGSAAFVQAPINLPYPAKTYHEVAILDAGLTGIEAIGLMLADVKSSDTNSQDMIDLEYMYAVTDIGFFTACMKFRNPTGGLLKLQYLVG